MNTVTFKHAARSAICFSAAAVVTLTLFSPMTEAKDRYIESSITVGFSDLDLSVPKDAAVLYRRIQKAARDACGGSVPSRTISQQKEFLACQDVAIARAVEHVGRSELLAVHRGKLARKSRNA